MAAAVNKEVKQLENFRSVARYEIWLILAGFLPLSSVGARIIPDPAVWFTLCLWSSSMPVPQR